MKHVTLDSLVGRYVSLVWADGSEWHWYRVGGIDRQAGWIFLEGCAAPDGTAFAGGDFWAPLSTIDTIEPTS